MDANVLIDAVVRQTTILLAQLATATGGRARLAHTANQIFIDLVHELKAQGLGNKVIADMFGVALRTYHEKVRRLSESTTVRGKSLWAVALEYLQERGSATQAELLERFSNDDEVTLRGVLADLVDSGLVFRTGRGAAATYLAREQEDIVGGERAESASVAALVWVAVSRFGPATVEALNDAVPLERADLEAAGGQRVRGATRLRRPVAGWPNDDEPLRHPFGSRDHYDDRRRSDRRRGRHPRKCHQRRELHAVGSR